MEDSTLRKPCGDLKKHVFSLEKITVFGSDVSEGSA